MVRLWEGLTLQNIADVLFQFHYGSIMGGFYYLPFCLYGISIPLWFDYGAEIPADTYRIHTISIPLWFDYGGSRPSIPHHPKVISIPLWFDYGK